MAFQQIGDSPLPPAGSPQNRDLALESDVVGMLGAPRFPLVRHVLLFLCWNPVCRNDVVTGILVMLLVGGQVTRVWVTMEK